MKKEAIRTKIIDAAKIYDAELKNHTIMFVHGSPKGQEQLKSRLMHQIFCI